MTDDSKRQDDTTPEDESTPDNPPREDDDTADDTPAVQVNGDQADVDVEAPDDGADDE